MGLLQLEGAGETKSRKLLGHFTTRELLGEGRGGGALNAPANNFRNNCQPGPENSEKAQEEAFNPPPLPRQ